MAVAVKPWEPGHSASRLRSAMKRCKQSSCLCLCCLLFTATPSPALGPAAPFEPPRAAVVAAALSAATTSDADKSDNAHSAHAAPQLGEKSSLQGVHHTGRTALALIDGQWWPVGSQVRGARLVSIQRHQVTLQHPDGRLEELALYPNPVKTARPALRNAGPLSSQQPRTP